MHKCLKAGRPEEVRLNAKLLTEAEEQCVHAHGVHAEESVGNEVGANDYSLVGTRRATSHTWIGIKKKARGAELHANPVMFTTVPPCRGGSPLTRMGTQ